MPVIHFKLAYKGNTHRFAPIVSEQQLFNEVHDRVAKIVKDERDFKLYWNDGDSNVLLGTADDLTTAVDFAVSGATPRKPPCVQLSVMVMLAAEKESEAAAVAAAAVDVQQQSAAPSAETVDATVFAPAVEAFLEFHKQEGAKVDQQLVPSNPTRTAVILSLRIHQDPETSDIRLSIHFEYASRYSLWERSVTNFFKHFNLPENRMTIDRHSRKLLFAVPSKIVDRLLMFLHHLAINTEFLHVQVVGDEKIPGKVAQFLERANVQQLTLTQEDDSKEKYIQWFRLIRRVKPSKLRVNRINVSRELLYFLMDASNVVDSLWIGSISSQEAFTMIYIRVLLRGKCSHVHVSDSATDISIREIESLPLFFREIGKPATIIVPSTETIRPRRYENKHVTFSVRNHEKEKNRMIIENMLRE